MLVLMLFTIVTFFGHLVGNHIFTYPETVFNETVIKPNKTIIFRVINGQPAQPGQFPYQVAFMGPVATTNRRGARRFTDFSIVKLVDSDDSDTEGTTTKKRGSGGGGGGYKNKLKKLKYVTFCGGTLIRRSAVLTAATCFSNKRLSNCFKGELPQLDLLRFFAVTDHLESDGFPFKQGQWRPIRRGRQLDSFKFPRDNIAVMYVAHPFVINENTNIIPVASKRIEYTGSCTVSGYGRTSHDPKALISKVLLHASMQVFDTETCNKMYGTDMSKFICTSDAVSNVQKGDTGGPIVCKGTGDSEDEGVGVVVGVFSHIDTKKASGALFTRVSSYSEFLNQSCRMEFPNLITLICMFLYFNSFLAINLF